MMAIYHILQLKSLSHLTFVWLNLYNVFSLTNKSRVICFTLFFHFHQEALLFLFTFSHGGGVLCISEAIDISPGSLDSSLCFSQPDILHDICKMQVRKQQLELDMEQQTGSK